MRRTTLITGALIIAIVGPTFAQDLLVEFVEGTVEYRAGAEWVEAFIGETIPSDTTIRVGDSSLVELRSAEESVLLSRPGSYALEAVLHTTHRNLSTGVASMVRSRVRKMVRDDAPPVTAAAGVRAAEALPDSIVTWAGGESVSDLIAEGILALDDEDYENAYVIFEEAREIAAPDEIDPTQFYLGYTAYLMGSAGEALALLERVNADPKAGFFHDHTLILAQLLVESFAYTDALKLLEEYVATGDPAPDDLQVAHLLQGLAHNGRGEHDRAVEQLESARKIDPESENGRLAAALITEL